MAKYKSGKHNKIAIGILFALVAVLAIGLITALFRVDTQIQTETLTKYSYEVGALSETDEGKELTSDGSIRTKDFHSVDGLTITLKKDAKVTYKIFCFDKDGEFLSAVSSVSDLPEGADTFRLVVTPTEDAEISSLDIGDYSGQLTVTFNK